MLQLIIVNNNCSSVALKRGKYSLFSVHFQNKERKKERKKERMLHSRGLQNFKEISPSQMLTAGCKTNVMAA